MQEGLLGGALSSDLRLRRSTLILFCESYSHLLTTQDDEEFFVKQIPFSLEQIRGMITVLRDTASAMYLSSDAEERYSATAPEDVAATRHLLGSMTHLLRRLFTRDSRRPFCEASHWVAPGARANNDAMVASVVDTHDARHGQWQRLCRLMPYAVPFESRVRIFHERVRRDRLERQGGPDDRGTSIRVRRDRLFEDALEQLGGLGDNIKSKLRVQFIDVHGLEEAGIDGGGLFKEFMHEIVRTAFGPDYALFKSTPDHLLYPNPSSDILGPEHLQHFHFLGLIVGKALYEGVLIDLPLAGFFLSKILGQFNFVDDLPSLDEELYRNLMFLKTYDGDCEDLHLNFAIVNSEYDETRVTELVPNGKDIAVTNENRVHYIHRVANYRLNFQIKRQSVAFLGGLREIIPTEWFQMFGESELQQVISGTRGGIDIDDLKVSCFEASGISQQLLH
jgi:ubiquitin-protein ligase E3 C